MAGEHDGHRKRMIQKLETGILLDHELLEIMLFSMQPRKNTNDIAHRLLQTFGSIEEIFCAPMEELVKVKGVGESTAANIRCIGIVYRKYFIRKREEYEGPYELNNFVSFLKEQYTFLDCEVFDVYLLGKSKEIVKRKRYTNTEGFEVHLTAAALSKLLTEEKPAGIVIVHNHPTGLPVTSKSDDETTMRCQLVCSMHNAVLCDHIIYSPSGVYSYYYSGKLRKISEAYSVDKLTVQEEEFNGGEQEK